MNFINGQWQQGHGTLFASFDPASGTQIWQENAANAQEVALAVQSARAAFLPWALTPLAARIEHLKTLQTLLTENIQNIAQVISLETGKTRWECVMEAQSMVNKIDISIDAYYQRTPEIVKPLADYQMHLRHKPLGVMAVFVPFNFPGHLLNTHVVPLLLAGNTVVIKPSELTPKSSQCVIELWEKAGLPAGVINLVQGAGEVGHALSTHADLNGICFTGSYRIGQMLHQQLAGHTEKMLVLEMGGNNPMIVGDISDFDQAVLTIIQSSFITAGQRCTCARRLIVIENATTDIFIKKLIEKMHKIRVAYPKNDPEPFMGPVISAKAGEQVLKQQQGLQQLGGKSLLTTTAVDPQNAALLSPGLIDMTGVDAPDEEIFGPLLQLHRVKDIDAAIALANRTQYGLTAGILTNDRKQYERFFNLSRAGTVNWNRPTTGISGIAPFGGLGHSGNFRPTGVYAADYCAYPVLSLESEMLQNPTLPPGLDHP